MALINPSLVAAATPPATAATNQAARKTNAEAYVAAMREAGVQAPADKVQAKGAATDSAAAANIAREAPFGIERPRYQRPGAVLDIRV